MPMWIWGIVICVLILLRLAVVAAKNRRTGGPPKVRPSYPHRPEVEDRLPNGSITTHSYAAQHPDQFAHWAQGPDNVFGEKIDPTDWEAWRASYYGQ